MRRGLAACALLLGVLVAGPTHAQPLPWESAEAAAEARRVVKAIQTILPATERQEAGPAIDAQRDRNWIVRLVAAVRLETLGLPAGTAAGLRRSAAPELGPLQADDPLLAAAREFAQTLEPDPQAVAEAPAPAEVVRIVASVVTERLLSGPEEPAAKQRLLESLLAYRKLPDARGRAWLAGRVLARADQAACLRDLKVKDRKAALGKDGAAVFAWYRANGRYHYWHPRELRLRLDAEARAAKTPSADYRRAHPWGPDQGPHAPPERAGR